MPVMGIPVAKKDESAKDELKEERINLMAEPSFVRKLEKAAKSLGLSISAYLRIAALEKMKRDARADTSPDA